MPYISTEALVGAGLIVILALGYQYTVASSPGNGGSTSGGAKKKNKNKNRKKASKGGAGGVQEVASSVTASEVDSDAPRSASAKQPSSKKTPAKQQPVAAPAPVTAAAPAPAAVPQPPAPKAEPASFAAAAGGSSQPVKPKTLAEKLVPKPRKTKVDDMLEPEDRPPQLARVMKIAPDTPPSTKLPRFEDDYEDTDSGASSSARQDDGWNVIAPKKKPMSLNIGSSAPAVANPHSKDGLTKVQRKNAKKAEVKKAQREAEEADRLRRLASHKRDLERAKINEIYNQQKKTVTRQGGKVVSAGQGATLNEKGQLVWD